MKEYKVVSWKMGLTRNNERLRGSFEHLCKTGLDRKAYL